MLEDPNDQVKEEEVDDSSVTTAPRPTATSQSRQFIAPGTLRNAVGSTVFEILTGKKFYELKIECDKHTFPSHLAEKLKTEEQFNDYYKKNPKESPLFLIDVPELLLQTLARTTKDPATPNIQFLSKKDQEKAGELQAFLHTLRGDGWADHPLLDVDVRCALVTGLINSNGRLDEIPKELADLISNGDISTVDEVIAFLS